MDINSSIANALGIEKNRIDAAIKLMDEGNTVPFIARYRKEVTGTLDDTQLRDIADLLATLRNLEKRRADILSAIEAQDALTPELAAAINAAGTLSALEDLYLPYKKKRATRASVAKAKGLEPLAAKIFMQQKDIDPMALCEAFIDPEKGVEDAEQALAGASDIIAETLSDDAEVRGAVRTLMQKTASLRTVSSGENPTYAMYADSAERVYRLPPHRILAINRGEKEGALKVSVQTDMDAALYAVTKRVIKTPGTPCAKFVEDAARDSLKRLNYPSLENELRGELFDKAAEQAIRVFGLNLKPLLMQPPLKNRVTLGFDPAYRTGCKLAVVDGLGKVLAVDVIYPTPPQSRVEEARSKLTALIKKYGVTAIAIGNGTASKESEIFVSDTLKALDISVDYMVVSEAGASVYSASKLGAEEFPQYDVSLRSAVSIARRLQDPLAELVKIDPKSIGVGQYQHDMPQKRLDETLKGVVEDCVNTVGVDVNTASGPLLSYISGIGPALAKNIVAYREENGGFTSRKELLKVPKLGKKAFEQCAGFLRVVGGEPLDNTGVHPESYAAANRLIALCGCKKGGDMKERLTAIDKKAVAEQLGIGVPTLSDMVTELLKPGRDPRGELKPLELRADIKDIADLKPGMVLEGTVRNVVDFGVFVDVGAHQDGLVHISRICSKYIKHPSEAVRVGDIVKVKVLEVDAARKRVALSMTDV